MSATEVMARQGEQAAVLGNLIGRLLKVLDKIIEGAYTIESLTQRIMPPPADIGSVNIKYYGPLAIAQQKLFKMRGIQEAIANVAPVIQLDPDAEANIDADYLVRYIMNHSDVPAKALLPPDEVEKRKAAKAVQASLTEQGAQTAPNAVLQGLTGSVM